MIGPGAGGGGQTDAQRVPIAGRRFSDFAIIVDHNSSSRNLHRFDSIIRQSRRYRAGPLVIAASLFCVGSEMASINSVSSSSDYSLPGINKSSAKGHRHHERQIEFEQDLTQAGLNASVTPDALLNSIQSSIRTAVNEPKNVGKDFLQVVQDAVQSTLKENGVDTEKLTALLQSQLGHTGQVPSFHDHLLDPTSSEDKPPKHGPHFVQQAGDRANQNDGHADDLINAKPERGSKVSQSDAIANSDVNGPSEVASEFKRLLAHLIQSLPSGSALDVHA